LSFEQMQDELLQSLLPPPPAKGMPADPSTAPASVVSDASPAPESIASAEAIAPSVEDDPASLARTVSAEASATPLPIVPMPEAEASAPSERAHTEEPPEDTTERAHALQVVAVLEQWIEAIHVARAEPRT